MPPKKASAMAPKKGPGRPRKSSAISPRKSPGRPKSAAKSPDAESKTKAASVSSDDPFANVPGHFPNYPREYSCIRSTKDWPETKEEEKARKEKVAKEKLGVMIWVFEKKEQGGRGNEVE